MWGIIGGSGFENFEQVEVVEDINIDTPFGKPSSGFKRIKVNGKEALFVSRHGKRHEQLPSEVNYRANVFAMKKLGAKQILCLSAVGSLEQVCKPGDLVIPKQFIDRTKSIRPHTFCGEGIVGHVSLAHPACPYWTEVIQKHASSLNFDVHFGKTAVCIEGPYFSTQAESKSYIAAGAEIIGMTSFPEYALTREAGLGYVPAFFVTDYDCWDDSIEHVTVEEVVRVMKKNNQKAFELMQAMLQEDQPSDEVLDYARHSMPSNLMTDPSTLPQDKQDLISVLKG